MKKTLRLIAQYTRNANNLKRILFTLFAFALISATAAAARAATLTVNTTADSAAFTTCTTDPNGCPLRGAIFSAVSGDTINFDAAVFASAQTITLGGTELAIGKNLTIIGTDANLLSINGNASSRVFEITSAFTVIIEKMTITNGKTPASGGTTASRRGGGIYNAGILTLNSVVISNNSAPGNTGGGIFSLGGSTLNLNNSTVTNNNSNSRGAGIFAPFGDVTINNSIISNNFPTTPGSNGGGGLAFGIQGAVATITNSTISGNISNTAGGGIEANPLSDDTRYNFILKNSTVSGNTCNGNRGGGIYIGGSGNGSKQYLIQNSTVSGNTATGSGGGIQPEFAGGNIINSTITNNTSNDTTDGGGGIFSPNSLGNDQINLLNTIIAGNINSIAPDIAGSSYISYGSNLIGNNQGGATYTGASGDQIGTTQNPINAQLAPLGNNGGTTQTHALLSNSPAINAGNNCVTTSTCAGSNSTDNLIADQRGAMRVGNVDIGSFEYFAPTAASVTVSGRAMTTRGRGIANVRITMTDRDGNTRTATTSSFGYYRFTDVAAGETYIFSAIGRRYSFTQQTQILTINEETNSINFIGDLPTGSLMNLGRR